MDDTEIFTIIEKGHSINNTFGYICRPIPTFSFPNSDRIAAYIGLFIMVSMAIYSRSVYKQVYLFFFLFFFSSYAILIL